MFNCDNYCWCRLPCGICSRTGQQCPKVSGSELYPSGPYYGTGMSADLLNRSGGWDPTITGTSGSYTKASVNSDGGKTEDKS